MVLTNDKGLNPADEGTYRRLVDTLRRDSQNVVMLQDFLSTPPLREVLASKDQKGLDPADRPRLVVGHTSSPTPRTHASLTSSPTPSRERC